MKYHDHDFEAAEPRHLNRLESQMAEPRSQHVERIRMSRKGLKKWTINTALVILAQREGLFART
jgi:hypothetical protein